MESNNLTNDAASLFRSLWRLGIVDTENGEWETLSSEIQDRYIDILVDLSRGLLEEMEHLETSYPEQVTWESLDDGEREFYSLCVLNVIRGVSTNQFFGRSANNDGCIRHVDNGE